MGKGRGVAGGGGGGGGGGPTQVITDIKKLKQRITVIEITCLRFTEISEVMKPLLPSAVDFSNRQSFISIEDPKQRFSDSAFKSVLNELQLCLLSILKSFKG